MHSIRAATPADVPLILDLIRALAAYEREPDAVKTDGSRPAARRLRRTSML